MLNQKEKLANEININLFDWVDVAFANEKRYVNITKVIDYYYKETIFLFTENPTTANLFLDEMEDLYIDLNDFLFLKPKEVLQIMQREVDESFDWYGNRIDHDTLKRIDVTYLYEIYNQHDADRDAFGCIEIYIKEHLINFIKQMPEDYIKDVQDTIKLHTYKINELWKKINFK